MTTIKTIEELNELVEKNGKVYVCLASEEIAKKFLMLAEQEGFTFGDGAKPTQKHTSDILAVNQDGTISHVGTVGRMAIGSGKAVKVQWDG